MSLDPSWPDCTLMRSSAQVLSRHITHFYLVVGIDWSYVSSYPNNNKIIMITEDDLKKKIKNSQTNIWVILFVKI